MGEKKYLKVIVVILVIIALLGVTFYYVQNNNKEEKENLSLKLGDYTVNEVSEDEAGVSNYECGVEIKSNNEFEIYMGWGAWHSGKYEIDNNKLICKSILFNWESGSAGSRETDVVFTFDIIETNKLQLSNIQINDEDSDKLIYDEGLTIGMTYSIK